MLVTVAYVPDKDTHLKRSSVTAEVVGVGYTAGGQACALTVTKDTVNDRVDVALSVLTWTTATITARALVLYKSRGGAATADELVAYIDFGSDIISTAGNFTFTPSGPIRFQN